MKTYIIIISSLCLVICLLVITNITLQNIESTGGIELSQLQTQLHTLQHDDTLVEQSVLEKGAYTQIASSSAAMGFVPSQAELSLTAPIPLAYR